VRWNGRLLVDGGAVNNFPVDVAAEEADVVLGVLLSSYIPQEPKSPADLILQTYYVTSHELLVTKLARARERLGERLLVVHPQVEEIGVLEFDRIDEAVAAGRQAVRPYLRRLRELLSR
jgi:NTE family protein